MSARSDGELVVEALKLLAPLGVAVAEAVIAAIREQRPDIQIAEPPPVGHYAEIVAEDEAKLRRRFGGEDEHG